MTTKKTEAFSYKPHRNAALTFLAMGYLLYFASLYLPTPQWGQNLMEWLTPTIKSLGSAARVAAHQMRSPFAVQVMILYGLLSWPVLLGVFSWFNYSTYERRHALLMETALHWKTQKIKKSSALLANIFGLLLFAAYLAWAALRASSGNSWQAIHIYSTNILSISLFWLGPTLLFSFTNSMAPIGIWLSLSRKFEPI